MGWQPIETAPKEDCARILMAFEGGEIAIVYWDDYYSEGIGHGFNGLLPWVIDRAGEQSDLHFDSPVAWMPLPEGPK